MVKIKNIHNYVDHKGLLEIASDLKNIVNKIDLQKYIDANKEVNLDNYHIDEPLEIINELPAGAKFDTEVAIVYDFNKWLIPKISNNTFNNVIKKFEKLPDVLRSFVLRMGPNSFVPNHIHPFNLKMFKELYRSELELAKDTVYEECNLDNDPRFYIVIIGLEIPSIITEDLGVNINGIKLNNDSPIIIDVRVPHSAWNKTDKEWIAMLTLVDSRGFK